MNFILADIRDYLKENYDIARSRLKSFVLAAPFWVLTAAVAVTSTGVGRYLALTHNRFDQRMNTYWEQESTTGYRQMSVYARGTRPAGIGTPAVYIDADNSLKRSDLILIRNSLQNAADSGRNVGSKGGLGQDGRPVGWEDCFSSYLNGNVTQVIDSQSSYTFSQTTETNIIAVEGNFPAFHPFTYVAGGFLPEIPTDTRQIVLNDVLAWRLYKSYDVLGERLELWGEQFTIIGVVSEPNDSLARSTGTLDTRAYIYFSAMEELAPLTDDTVTNNGNGNNSANGANISSSTLTPPPASAAAGNSQNGANGNTNNTTARPEMAVLCYEAMLPELVRGVGRTDMAAALPNYNPAIPKYYVVSNTGRYNVIDTWRFMWPIGKTQAKLAPYEFPYWERCAQSTSAHLFADELLVGLGTILLFIGVVMVALRHRKMSRK
ncbi:MAG: ABC transporter permease [Saccharofermentans sp.]|nr:ABC transporter permease [Saccharofermentans sp.]